LHPLSLPLPHPVVKDHEVQQNFEAISTAFPLQGKNIANDVLLLASTGTRRSVAFGTGTVTFTASASSDTPTVTHGLGATPTIVLITLAQLTSVFVNGGSYTATTFQAQGFAPFGAITGSATFGWVAIG
jgi:hypothetical protein